MDYPPLGIDKGLPRTIHASVPYPVRAGTSTIFGLSVANGGSETKVKQIDILLPGGFDLRKNGGRGAELFAAGGAPEVVNGTGNGGVWKHVDARHIRWNGLATVGAAEAAEFLVAVNITSDLTKATSIEGSWTPPISAELTYENGYATVATGWGATPGFVRTLVRPDALLTTDADGYPFTELVGSQTLTYEVNASIETRMQTITGAANYTVLPSTADLSGIQSALGNASVHVSQRVAPLGSLVQVDHDVSSLVTKLADQGAGAIKLTTELYTPATKGCGPTKTWSRDASTLPLARLNDLVLYDDAGLGAPSVFLASEDKSAYKLNTLGVTAWSQPDKPQLSAIAAATLPGLGASVFTGSTVGSVSRLDATLAGEMDWSAALPVSVDPASDPEVREIAYDAGSGRLLVRTDQMLVTLDSSTGTTHGSRDTRIVTNKVRQAEWDVDGTVLALTTHHLERLDANAGLIEVAGVEEAVGFSVTPLGIMVAQGDHVTIYDPTTLVATQPPLTLVGTIALAASGDATGDGIRDLVVAMDTLTVHVISGQTGTVVATRYSSLPDIGEFGTGVPDLGPIWMQGDSIGMNAFDPATHDCPDDGGLVTLYDLHACVAVYDPNNLVPLPTDLQARDGRILYSYRLGGVAKTVAWDDDGAPTLDKQWGIAIMPTSMTMGPWSGGTWAYAVASSDGKVWLFSETTGTPLWTVQPTAMTGKFTFTLRVPMGGFFGSHILVTRVLWEDPVFGEQQVAIPEWFQVVAPDGTAVLSPWYDVSALIELQDDPMTMGRFGP